MVRLVLRKEVSAKQQHNAAFMKNRIGFQVIELALHRMNDQEKVAERGRRRAFITLFFFLSGILSATWSSRIPDIQHQLQLSNAALGTVLFALPVGLFTALSFASWAVASYGAVRIMLLSTLLLAFFLVFTGFVSTTILLMVALFLMGVCRTLINLSANTGAIEVQRLYDKPIVAFFHGMWSIACFVAAGIGTVLIIFGVEPFLHFLGIGLLSAVIVLFFLKKGSSSNQTVERRPFFVKPDRYLFLLGLMALSSMLCEGAMFDWSVNYFEKVVKADKKFVTAGYIAFIVTMAGGRLIGDRLIHLFGIHRILMIAGVLMASGFITAAVFPLVVPAALGFALIGIGDSVLVPVIYLLASKSTKMPASYALASVTMVGYMGFLIGPLLIGNVSEHLGMSTAFIILSIVSLMLVLLTLQVKKLSP